MVPTQRFTVKSGLSTLDQKMTHKQALRWGNQNMPADLKRAGFETVIFTSNVEIHGSLFLRVNYGRSVKGGKSPSSRIAA
jgi:hypothetical protein